MCQGQQLVRAKSMSQSVCSWCDGYLETDRQPRRWPLLRSQHSPDRSQSLMCLASDYEDADRSELGFYSEQADPFGNLQEYEIWRSRCMLSIDAYERSSHLYFTDPAAPYNMLARGNNSGYRD